MKKILVAYSTLTGNTKKVAMAMANGHMKEWGSVDTLDIKDVKDPNEYDLIFIGGWIDKGYFDKKAKEFLETLSGKNIATFYTLGAYPDSDHGKNCTKRIGDGVEEKNTLVSQYHCQGAIDPKLIEMMSKFPKDHSHYPDEARIKRWEEAALHPDTKDLQEAENFYKATLEKFLG